MSNEDRWKEKTLALSLRASAAIVGQLRAVPDFFLSLSLLAHLLWSLKSGKRGQMRKRDYRHKGFSRLEAGARVHKGDEKKQEAFVLSGGICM